MYLHISTDVVAEYTIIDSAAISNTTALWCNYGNDGVGQWHHPNGSVILDVPDPIGEGGPVYVEYGVGQVGLYRVKPLGLSQGVYICAVSYINGSSTNLSVVLYDNSTLMNLSGNGLPCII